MSWCAKFFDHIIALDWLDVANTGAAVSTAAVAILALRNWRRQDTAKRETDFLDQTIDATHDFVIGMGRVIWSVQNIKIGFEAHQTLQQDVNVTKEGVVAFINHRGDAASTRLQDALDSCRSQLVELRTLAAKGQIYDFTDYNELYDAISILVWQHDRCNGLLALIGSSTWNWDHPDVISLIEKVVLIEPDDISSSIHEQNVAVIDYCRKQYRVIYR